MGLMRDKVAVITGAGQGIGRNHALRFAAEGARVVVNDIGVGVRSGEPGSGMTRPTGEQNPAIADQVVDEIRARGGQAVADHSDVSTFAGGEALIAAALAEFGGVDTLINNAGTLTIMKIGDLDEERVTRELAVHVVGYLGTIQAAWEPLKRRGGGTIVNTASGFGGSAPGLATYMAAKAGVFSLTRDAAYEGARHGIRCNSLTPSARTRLSVPYWGSDQTEDWDLDWASTLALYLASDLSGDLSGRQLSIMPGNVAREWYVDGGSLENEEDWTPQTLADRIGALLHKQETAGGLRIPDLLD